MLNLGITWPADKFDSNSGCRSRSRKDPDVDDYNIIIGNARALANEIFKEHLKTRVPLTVESFKRQFRNSLNKQDFIKYMEQQSFARWNKMLIKDNTRKSEKTTIAKLEEFAKQMHLTEIPFYSFSHTWAQEFEVFLKKLNVSQNTRWHHHKMVKTYLHMANRDNISFIDPYKYFIARQTKGRWKALSLSEHAKLLKMYLDDQTLIPKDKIILRRFLFSCNTGLRISDLRRLTVENFKDNRLTIRPHKTERYGTNINDKPLNDIATLLLSHEMIDSVDGRLFYRYTDMWSNVTLKEIAKRVKIETNLHNHVGRFTFASLYDQAGGNHRSLLEFMGLTKMDTLHKYVQTNNEVANLDIDKVNKMIKPVESDSSQLFDSKTGERFNSLPSEH